MPLWQDKAALKAKQAKAKKERQKERKAATVASDALAAAVAAAVGAETTAIAAEPSAVASTSIAPSSSASPAAGARGKEPAPPTVTHQPAHANVAAAQEKTGAIEWGPYDTQARRERR